MIFKKFLSIIRKEYLHFFKDKGAMLIMIFGVFGYSVFYAVPYATEIIKDVPIGIVDFDKTNLSREFIRKLDASDYVAVNFDSDTVNDAEKEFFKDNIRGYVVIPKDFQKNIYNGNQSTISLYADSSYLIIYKSIYSGVIKTAISLGAKIEVAKMMKSGIQKQMAIALKQPFQFVETSLYNPAGGYGTYIFPVVLILILHQTLIVGMGLMFGAKNELKHSYGNSKYIGLTIFGRTTAYVILYLFYSIYYFIIYPTIVVYPMAYNVIPLFITLILMFYSAGFLAHTISFFFKTRESSLLLLVSSSLIFVFLPGLIWPKEAIPTIINWFASLIPATKAVDAIIKINQMNATLWDVKYNLFILIVLTVVYYFTAKYVIKKAETRKN